jgi:hypothetical protein
MQPIRFKPHQRAELLKIGLVPEEIDAIETEGLPVARRILERRPPKSDVLAELQVSMSTNRDGLMPVIGQVP